eukprot:NODE_472_length_7027_cov_1.012413.p4 type:complete len:256 gc:universal NODE_472_length_7027_cov_1.012413:4219-3452(-)
MLCNNISEILISALFFWALRGILEFIPPSRRGFFLDDISIQYPNDPSIISVPLLLLLGFIIPIAIIPFIKRKNYPIWIAGLLLCVGLVDCITTILKLMVGRLRPHFLAVCHPDFNETPKFSYIHPYHYQECTNESDPTVVDGRMSFPSGHSSLAFSGLSYLALTFRDSDILKSSTKIRSVLFAVPIILAAYIAISRTIDHHHHVEDVVIGSLIGILGALKIEKYILDLQADKDTGNGDIESGIPLSSVTSLLQRE